MKLITAETLKQWNACTNGFKRFCELFPEGATLKVASEALIEDGNVDLSNWLWKRCKNDQEYNGQTSVFAGHHGTAIAGDFGNAIAGNYGTAITGEFGAAVAGHYGTATAGNHSTATAGNYGTVTAGYGGMATACYGGTATAGNYGCISLLFRDGMRLIRRAFNVGDGGLKPNTPYKLDKQGNPVEAIIILEQAES